MLEAKSMTILRNGLLLVAILTTLCLAPYSSLDPVSLPKMSILVFLSVLISGTWLFRIKKLIKSEFQTVTALASIFILLLALIVIFSGTGIWAQIYGTFGRNTGALTYFSLVLLLLGTVIAVDEKYIVIFIRVFMLLGIVLVIYGQIQNQGLDPFPFQNAYASNVFGTLGNPDFMSAFMGIIGVVSITISMDSKLRLVLRLISLILTLASLLIIHETNAMQGYLNFAAGIVSVFTLWLFINRKYTLAYIVSTVAGIAGGLLLLGLFNLGPLAIYLFKASLQARGFYWRAAINMLKQHPLFGVGMDGYGDWYRQARNLNDTLINPELISDAAHNVFLDIASNGGFPLIGVYVAILIFVLVSIVRVVKRSKKYNPYFVASCGAWIAYQTQSFVSINAIGLAIWGWILGGLIIGFEISTRDQKENLSNNLTRESKKNTKRNVQVLSSSSVLSIFTSTVLASVLAIPPYIAANKFYNALKSGNVLELQPAAYLKPYDRVRFTFVASNLAQNGLNDRALVVIRDAVKLFPNSFEAWKILADLPNASAAENAQARAEMKRLDPYNPYLK